MSTSPELRYALAEVLNSELALVKPEAIPRLPKAYNADEHRNFDSHIIGKAIQALDDKGMLTRRTALGKGGPPSEPPPAGPRDWALVGVLVALAVLDSIEVTDGPPAGTAPFGIVVL